MNVDVSKSKLETISTGTGILLPFLAANNKSYRVVGVLAS
jgi:hypothetical protein